MGVHGGTDETALMLHLRPELVDMGKASRQVPEHLAENRHVRFGGSVQFGWTSDDFGDHGFIGDPTQATPELGRRLFGGAVRAFADALHEIAAFRHRT
jgi:creatinine amidohydrolase